MSKEKTCPDFIKGATNVYRTKKYIVKQRIDIEVDMEDDMPKATAQTRTTTR